jgi:hypothetical protein
VTPIYDRMIVKLLAGSFPLPWERPPNLSRGSISWVNLKPVISPS